MYKYDLSFTPLWISLFQGLLTTIVSLSYYGNEGNRLYFGLQVYDKHACKPSGVSFKQKIIYLKFKMALH